MPPNQTTIPTVTESTDMTADMPCPSGEDDKPIMQKHAKIISTLGPASSNEKVLKALLQAGANVIRLNFSHGSEEQHQRNIQRIRRISAELNLPVSILVDLQGPKLRTGPLENHLPINLVQGATIELTSKQQTGNTQTITTPAADLVAALEPGNRLLLDDGKILLEVTQKIDAGTLRCNILQGGELKENKGINVPDVSMAMKALTEKDKQDAVFAINQDVDYLALSFVRQAEDVEELKKFIADQDLIAPPIVAKIEKPQAVQDIDRILDVADAMMVARGDLAVELSHERVPAVQKLLVEKANLAGKPVIVATQMLESMMESFTPLRAEVSDVANAVFDGADALMLSGETAVGSFPVETVQTMAKIISEAEKSDGMFLSATRQTADISSSNASQAIAQAAADLARDPAIQAIVVLSTSGTMARRISKQKPPVPIITITPEEATYNRMSLLWGVLPLVIPYGASTEETLEQAGHATVEKKLLHPGDTVVFCAGKTPLLGASNMLKVYQITAE